MITAEIDFHAPRAIDDALALLAEYGDDVKLLAGGMSLVPAMNLGLARPTIVISLNHVDGLNDVTDAGDAIRIGATVRHARVVRDPLITTHVPLLAEAAAVIGDPQVRNRGTIGGSIAHADPAADYLPVLAALGASMVVRSQTRERTIPALDFFVDMLQTALEPNELLVEVLVPKAPAGSTSAYRRLARVEGSFAIVNAAAVVDADGVSGRVAIGAVDTRPIVVDLAGLLDGAAMEATLNRVRTAAEEAAAGSFGDLNASPDYRRAMAGVFAARAVAGAFERRI